MKWAFPKRRQFHVLHLLSTGLAVVALTLIMLSSHNKWWGIVEISNAAGMFHEYSLEKKDVVIEISMGVDEFDVKAMVSQEAYEKGFSDKVDTFLWGILSLQCQQSSSSLSQDVCDTRRSITSIASSTYVMLSIELLLLSSIVAIMTLSSSPVVHSLSLFSLYSASIVFLIVPLLMYEIKLKNQLTDVIGWGIYDDNIHTSLAGLDSPKHFPEGVKYEIVSPTSFTAEILMIVALVCIVVSFVSYTVRYYRNRKHRGYMYNSDTFFEKRKSRANLSDSSTIVLTSPNKHSHHDDSSPRRKKNN